MATLGNLYGVNVDHYIRINFAGFISIIDAWAAWMSTPIRRSPRWAAPATTTPPPSPRAGTIWTARVRWLFARERHAFASGDIQRGINQMKVIDAMANKLKSPTVLMSFSKLMDAASNCFVTSSFAGSDQCAGADAAERLCRVGY